MKIEKEPGALSCKFNSSEKNIIKIKIDETGFDLFFGEFYPVWVWLYDGKVSVSLNKLVPYRAKDFYNLLWKFLKEGE
jgi:hypothetical protein